MIAPITATGSTTARSLPDRFADVVNVLDFGADPTGTNPCAYAINAAIASIASTGGKVYLPAGTYLIRGSINISNSNIALFGDGVGVTTISCADPVPYVSGPQYSAIDIRTSSNNNNIYAVTLSNFSINGNISTRQNQKPTPTSNPSSNGIMVLCDSANKIGDVRIENVDSSNNPNAGILLQGYQNGVNDAYKVERTIITGCRTDSNGGTGVSQFKVNNSTITDCIFSNSGKENLTVDVYSNACVIDGNRFFRHLGGTGNIGIDTGDACIISNNFIDCESLTSGVAPYRTGISCNSQLTGAQGDQDVVISGNVILNCVDYGVYEHNDTGLFNTLDGGFSFTGDIAGNAVITGNTFNGNGTDLRIDHGVGPSIVKGNKIQSILINENVANNVRFGAGEIAFKANLSSDQSITLGVTTPTWTLVSMGVIDSRLTSLSSGQILLPTGGLYTFTAKVRVTGLLAAACTYASVGIFSTPTGGSQTLISLFNVNLNSSTPLGGVQEFLLSTTQIVNAGVVGLYFRANATTAATVTVSSVAVDTNFTGSILG
jgi:hypothetical protein